MFQKLNPITLTELDRDVTGHFRLAIIVLGPARFSTGQNIYGVDAAHDLTKHIEEYQRKLKASRAAMGIAVTFAAAKPKGKKKTQTGKKGYDNVNAKLEMAVGLEEIAYVQGDDNVFCGVFV
ncbi:hypothetical protein PsorP6_008949 [Peronosclerospora sorghi]|uniref:Uncharacterized protein n=1 Tax=Peronosclerospora sorghi TaxID=230839 RepID=A0ACC0VZ35_9STRA|nr:hypothetical protein PsorP6_008949 [Peronosclerospora sorghi]